MGKSVSRRIFLGNETESFQIFSIAQNRNDASIYFSAPSFAEIQRHLPVVEGTNSPALLSYQAGSSGKLSLHGTGVTHVSPFESDRIDQFSISGNALKSEQDDSLGFRHLLTIFFAELKHKPNSPAEARRTDRLLTTRHWHPYVLIFWAVPRDHPPTISIGGSCNADELEEVPPHGGWGAFTLSNHSVVWFAYRTKFMEKWPLYSQAFYNNGFHDPLFVGTGVGQFRLEYRSPQFTANGSKLSVLL